MDLSVTPKSQGKIKHIYLTDTQPLIKIRWPQHCISKDGSDICHPQCHTNTLSPALPCYSIHKSMYSILALNWCKTQNRFSLIFNLVYWFLRCILISIVIWCDRICLYYLLLLQWWLIRKKGQYSSSLVFGFIMTEDSNVKKIKWMNEEKSMENIFIKHVQYCYFTIVAIEKHTVPSNTAC